MEEIKDINIYNTRMSKSIIDKMFFMDKIDEETTYIVDYGCADGSLIAVLAPMFPAITFIGYDNNEEMLNLAIVKTAGMDNVYFLTGLHMLNTIPGFSYDKAALVLSSVVHEVYSYLTGNEINEFWNYVNNSGYRYIVMRDMCVAETAIRSATQDDVIKVRAAGLNDMINDFEAIHGKIDRNYNLIHFLMKYKYVENWNREVRENYLPLTLNGLLGQFSSNYMLEFFDHYTLPYLRRTVMKDFGIHISDKTHIKLIYKNKGNN